MPSSARPRAIERRARASRARTPTSPVAPASATIASSVSLAALTSPARSVASAACTPSSRSSSRRAARLERRACRRVRRARAGRVAAEEPRVAERRLGRADELHHPLGARRRGGGRRRDLGPIGEAEVGVQLREVRPQRHLGAPPIERDRQRERVLVRAERLAEIACLMRRRGEVQRRVRREVGRVRALGDRERLAKSARRGHDRARSILDERAVGRVARARPRAIELRVRGGSLREGVARPRRVARVARRDGEVVEEVGLHVGGRRDGEPALRERSRARPRPATDRDAAGAIERTRAEIVGEIDRARGEGGVEHSLCARDVSELQQRAARTDPRGEADAARGPRGEDTREERQRLARAPGGLVHLGRAHERRRARRRLGQLARGGAPRVGPCVELAAARRDLGVRALEVPRAGEVQHARSRRRGCAAWDRARARVLGGGELEGPKRRLVGRGAQRARVRRAREPEPPVLRRDEARRDGFARAHLVDAERARRFRVERALEDRAG